MIIGSQKCGTTSLAYQLSQHPEICFCREKEPHFFSVTEDWRANLTTYHNLFAPAPGQLCGEASTSYTFHPEYPHTPQHIFEYNPEIRLIYIMRQPVDRIVSLYAHRLLHAGITKPPEEEVIYNPMYVHISRYSMQIRPFLELFTKKNILLLIFEEFISDPHKTLEKIASFLGIPSTGFDGIDTTARNVSAGECLKSVPGSRLVQAMLNTSPSFMRKIGRKHLHYRLEKKPEFSEPLKQTLWRLLEDDVHNIEKLMGRRLPMWRKGYR